LNYGRIKYMKKALLILIIIIGAAAVFYAWRSNSTDDKTVTSPTANSGSFKPDPSNATFTIDDEPISLSAGRNEGASGEETTLLDKFAYGDINADGKVDTALFLVQSGGGSGTFLYLAGYVSGPVNYKGSDATFIGDRVAPQSISISKGIVTIKYLDRGPDDSFATEPTISVSKQFVYKDGELVEK